jgi:hypothetical protein
VTRSNLCKIYTNKELSLNEKTNVLQGKIEIHLFRPKSLDLEIKEDQTNAFKFKYQEKDLEPLSAEKIISEVKLIREEFDALLQ